MNKPMMAADNGRIDICQFGTRPRATWTDEQILHWVWVHDFHKRYPLPKLTVPLHSADPRAPDVATVHYDRPGTPIERGYSVRPGAK